MTTEKMYEFLVLSKTLNYSKAANTLYISQSVLSKHIKDMEKELNVSLFERNTHEVILTNAGQLLAQEAAAIINDCNNTQTMLQLHNLPSTGSIRIACVLEFSYSSHIQIFIHHFTEHYPDIDVQFHVLSGGTPENILEQYDFVFTPCDYPVVPENIHRHFINSHGTYAVLSPGHRLLSKSLLQLRELEGETIIVPFAHELFGPYAANYQLIKKYTHDYVTCISAPNLSTALFMVSIGKGIAIVPRYVKNMVPNNTFMVGISNSNCLFHEYLYYQENEKNGAAKLFYEEFRNTFPGL